MKRPSFQFYTGDWQSNAKLRRCSHAEKGIWLDVMCLMHDSETYGAIDWPLKDIAQAVGCKVSDLRGLIAKDVLKGADPNELVEAFTYTPRHGGKDGETVTLIETRTGPYWYSSRMVRDEYVRIHRGIGTRFGETPKPPIGEPPTQREGDGASTSSSSSEKQKQSASRGSRLPLDWLPSPEEREYAKQKRGWAESQIDRVAEDFRDYWTAQPGQRGVKVLWSATWRKWIRDQREPTTGKPNGIGGHISETPKPVCRACKLPITGTQTAGMHDACWEAR